jgi:fucose permease
MLTIQAYLSDQHGPRRAIAIAEANVAASGCSVLAALSVGGFERAGIDGRYALLLAIGAAALLATRFRGVTMPRSLPPAAGRRRVSRKLPAAFWLAAAILFLGTSAEWSIGYWGAEFLDRKGGLSSSTAAAAMSAFYLAMAAGRFAGSRLAHRFPERTLLLGTLAIAIAGFPALWLAPMPLRLAGLFVTGLGIASIYPLVMSVGIAAVPSAPDVAAARMLLAGSSAVLMAPFVLGVLADLIGIRMAFGVALPLLAIGLIAVTRLRLDQPEPVAHPAEAALSDA